MGTKWKETTSEVLRNKTKVDFRITEQRLFRGLQPRNCGGHPITTSSINGASSPDNTGRRHRYSSSDHCQSNGGWSACSHYWRSLYTTFSCVGQQDRECNRLFSGGNQGIATYQHTKVQLYLCVSLYTVAICTGSLTSNAMSHRNIVSSTTKTQQVMETSTKLMWVKVRIRMLVLHKTTVAHLHAHAPCGFMKCY